MNFVLINLLFTAFTIISLRPIAKKFGLVDKPNYRKTHHGDVPYIGGLCIFINLLFSQIYLNEPIVVVNLILITSFLILIIGTCDDILNLKAKTKLFFQILLIFITIILVDIKIENIGYFPILSSLKLGYLAIPLTVIGICGFINATNMMDGSDGVAGSLMIVAITGILLKSFPLEEYMFFDILLSLTSALIPFLFFNIFGSTNYKIFLGDGGSLFLGFIVVFILVYNSQNIDSFNATYALWCVAIIIYDFFSVIILRKIETRPLHIATNDHIHHLLGNLGLSKKIILIIIVSFGVAFLYIGYFLESNFKFLSFPIFIMLFIIYFYSRSLLISYNNNLSQKL